MQMIVGCQSRSFMSLDLSWAHQPDISPLLLLCRCVAYPKWLTSEKKRKSWEWLKNALLISLDWQRAHRPNISLLLHISGCPADSKWSVSTLSIQVDAALRGRFVDLTWLMVSASARDLASFILTWFRFIFKAVNVWRKWESWRWVARAYCWHHLIHSLCAWPQMVLPDHTDIRSWDTEQSIFEQSDKDDLLYA